MENKKQKIWFDILMYTVLVISITYLIFLNQMQKYFIYVVVIGYILVTSFKVVALTHLKHNNIKKE